VLEWLDTAPLYAIGLILLALMLSTAACGFRLRRRLELESSTDTGGKWHHDYDGYVISAVLGLLTLLLSFTFSLAIGR